MKRFICTALAICMLLTLCACGKKAKTPEETPPPEATGQPEVILTMPEDDDFADLKPAEGSPYQISWATLIDNENVKVDCAAVLEEENGVSVCLQISNKTDESVQLGIVNSTVNKMAMDPHWIAKIEPKTISNERIFFENNLLKTYGIETIDEWLFHLEMKGDSGVHKYGCAVYPTLKSKDEIQRPERPEADGELTVIDDENATFIIVSHAYDYAYARYALIVFAYNKTDEACVFSANNSKINGVFCEPYWQLQVEPGEQAYSEICYYDSDLSLVGLDKESIKEITFTLSMKSADNWMKPPFVETPVAINID